MATIDVSEENKAFFMFDAMISNEVTELAERTLKPNKQLTMQEAQLIAKDLLEIMRLEPVRVHFMSGKYEMHIKDVAKGQIAGKSYPKSRAVVLWKIGHKVSVLLHEIAHLMPGGDRGHFRPEWVDNFKNLVTLYNERFGVA